MRSTGQILDDLAAEAFGLLSEVRVNDVDPIFRPDVWQSQRDKLTEEYRREMARRAVHCPPAGENAAADASGGVDVRAIVGEVLLSSEATHKLYHTDPATRHGIEVAMGVLSIVAGVLVSEGDSPELAAHIVHIAAHRLSDNSPPPGVDLDALGTANTELDLADLDRAGTPGTLP